VSTCRQLCKLVGASGCASNERCQQVTTSDEVGVCLAKAVCGDGQTDIYLEKCDDGNVVSGDGCKGDCSGAEFDNLCGKAQALPLNQTTMSTTLGGARGYYSSCGLYDIVETKTFSFLAPGEGTLELEVNASTSMLVTAYSDCADPFGSELGCKLGRAAQRNVLKLKFDGAQAKATLIAVMGKNTASGGAFTLNARFVPAVCGDGKVSGREQCDDGNTANDDGCSATCKVEWPVLCGTGAKALPLLSLAGPNMGTTLGQPDRTSTEGECTTLYDEASGADALYRFQAPSAGTLKLKLSSQTGNQNIFGYGPCGAKTDFQKFCANSDFKGKGEALDDEMTNGESIVVGVESQGTADGPFTLEAQFVP
jgi:cysteine-rich repeat protein